MCQMNKIEILSHEEHQSRDNHRLSIAYKNTITTSAPLEDIHDTCGCHLSPTLLSVPLGKKINCLRRHGANKWDKWPAGTNDYCGGQCLGQMMFEVNAINIIARHMWHELQLIDDTFVKWIDSHSHGSHNKITKTTPWMIWHMIERWAFPKLRPALLHTPKERLAHVWLVTDTCVHWDCWVARVWMTCQAFMMIWCSALPPFLTNPNWVKQTLNCQSLVLVFEHNTL